MCDWEAEEYAEFLLWVEAERVRARGDERSEAHACEPLVEVAVPPTPVEA